MFSFIINRIRRKILEGRYQKLIQQSQEMISYNRRESERISAKANELFRKIARLNSMA